MKTSRIITLVLLMLLFSFICDIESHVWLTVNCWKNQLQSLPNIGFDFPSIEFARYSKVLGLLK